MDASFYWENGLHDADIIDFKEITFNYNVKDKNPIRNCLELIIDSSHALFNTRIKGIKLYNYKILSELKNPKNQLIKRLLTFFFFVVGKTYDFSRIKTTTPFEKSAFGH